MKGWARGVEKMANLSNKLSSRSLWETSSRLVRLALRLLVVERVRDEKSIEEGRSTLERVLAPNRCFLPFPSLSLFLPPLSSPSPTLIRSQERVDRVAHTLLHRGSSGLERPRALHPLRHAALSKIQPFLGRSTNRRQLTTG